MMAWKLVSAAAAAAVLVLGACARDDATGGTAAAGAWFLSPDPSLHIGVVEGDEAYQLHDVRDVARLPGGGLAIAHQGTREVRIYDAQGRFLAASGEDGDGPGQWRSIAEVRALSGDTLLVVDHRLERYGFVDAGSGAYLGAADPSRADSLRWNRWHRGGLLLEAPPHVDDPTLFEAVVTALDVRDASAPTWARLDAEGRVWVLSAPSAPAPTLRLFDLDGTERASLPLPDRFQPMEMAHDEVLGLWRDSLDVQHVRVHALDGPTAWDGPRPEQATPHPAPAVTAAAPVAELPELSMPFRNVAAAQEIGYATRGSYTADAEALAGIRDLELPADTRLDILDATPTGWMGRIVDTATGAGCMLVYGAYPPVDGISSGTFSCWDAVTTP